VHIYEATPSAQQQNQVTLSSPPLHIYLSAYLLSRAGK
jgi:hypothetical protein